MADLLIGQDPRPDRAPLLGHAAPHAAEPRRRVRTRRWPASSWRSGTSRPRRSACPSTSSSAVPMRDRVRLYWSHCGTTRARMGHVLGTPPLQDLRRHRGARARGGRARLHRAQDQHRSSRANRPPCTSRASPAASTRPTARRASEILEAIERLIGTFRDAVGPQRGLVPRPATTTSAPRACCASPSCSSSSTCSGSSTTTGTRRRSCRSSSRRPRAWPRARAW